MRPLRIQGETGYIGRAQGYLGLSVLAHLVDCPVNGPQTPSMMTVWEPNPREAANIAAGALVYLDIIGNAHPPVNLYAGPPPGAEGPMEFPRDTRLERIAAIVPPTSFGGLAGDRILDEVRAILEEPW